VFGAEATGRYGSILLMVALVHAGAEVVTPMVSSAVMAYYAAGDREGLRRLAARSIKLLGVGLALPIGLLCGLGEPLLALWLGPAFADLHVVLALLVAHLTFNLALRPLAFVMTACEKVKVQGLVTIALGLVNIALAVALARWSGLGIAGVAAAAALVWTVKNVGFLAIYGAAVLGARWWTFCTPLLPGLAGMLGVALAGRLVLEAWRPQTWLDLAGVGAAISTAYGLAALAVLVDRSDRGLLWRMVRRT
jgi:membrane protein EpsK